MKRGREEGLSLRGVLGASMITGAVFLLTAGFEIFGQSQISTFSTAWLVVSICLMALSGIVHLKG